MDVFQHRLFKQEHLVLEVGIAEYSVQVKGWTIQGTNPGRGKCFIVYHGYFSRGVMRPGREVSHALAILSQD